MNKILRCGIYKRVYQLKRSICCSHSKVCSYAHGDGDVNFRCVERVSCRRGTDTASLQYGFFRG